MWSLESWHQLEHANCYFDLSDFKQPRNKNNFGLIRSKNQKSEFHIWLKKTFFPMGSNNVIVLADWLFLAQKEKKVFGSSYQNSPRYTSWAIMISLICGQKADFNFPRIWFEIPILLSFKSIPYEKFAIK